MVPRWRPPGLKRSVDVSTDVSEEQTAFIFRFKDAERRSSGHLQLEIPYQRKNMINHTHPYIAFIILNKTFYI